MSRMPRLFHRCPCCGAHTLRARARYDICTLCGWEDDGQDDPHAGERWGGPNGDYTLTEARANARAYSTMYRPSDRAFAIVRHPILGPAGETAIDRVALRRRAYAEFAQFANGRGEALELPERLQRLLTIIENAGSLYDRSD